MSDDELDRLLNDLAEKRDAEEAQRERIAEARIARLRDAGMTDEQIRVTGELIQELLAEQNAQFEKAITKAGLKLRRP